MDKKEGNIVEALRSVQIKLNAPKNQRNTFGNYNYRSCEDILEAVKPLLNDNGLTLFVSDTIEAIGSRYYVKSEATISDGTGQISVTAYAREAKDKKGMDAAQITGATSSYARKYALNGLFAIDDAKDADTDEHRNQQDNAPARPKASSSKAASEKQIGLLRSLMEAAGIDPAAIKARLSLIETSAEASDAIEKMQAKLSSRDAA